MPSLISWVGMHDTHCTGSGSGGGVLIIGDAVLEPLLSLLLFGVPAFFGSPSTGFVDRDLLGILACSEGPFTPASSSGSTGTLTGGGPSDMRFLYAIYTKHNIYVHTVQNM